jgi:ATPase subunit of ABC transporter with duplicated ATPase domains
VLAVHGLSKRFEDGVVLAGVSFSLQAGKKVGLVGANGTGKSTLLRILAGQDRADAGSIRWEPGAIPGYMPQQVEAESDQTVGDLIASGQRAWRDAKREYEEAVSAMSGPEGASDRALDAYAVALERFEVLGGYAVEQRVEEIKSGLGIGGIALNQPVAQLSGGEKTRVSLGALLLSEATVLLLDEPTNYLDLPALLWLESFVRESPQAAIIVSHDREFLDNTVTSILEIDESSRELTVYPGAYSEFLTEKERARSVLEARYRDQVERIEKVEAEIRNLKNRARRTEQGTINFHYRKIAKGVARRATVQERRLQRSMDSEGHIERPEYDRSLYLRSLSESGIAEQRLVLSAKEISVAFGDRVIFDDLSLTIRGGDRVALIGPNGSGKTTLLEVLAGIREPGNGNIEFGTGVIVGYLRQEHLRLPVDPRHTVLDAMRKAGIGEEAAMRAILDQFLFTGQEVMKSVRSLSYGERVRLELAGLIGAGANVLMLDEPTNHLDLPAVERLQAALQAYRGPLVVSSHDRAFIDGIGVSAVWLMGDGGFRSIVGEQPLADAWQRIASMPPASWV